MNYFLFLEKGYKTSGEHVWNTKLENFLYKIVDFQKFHFFRNFLYQTVKGF